MNIKKYGKAVFSIAEKPLLLFIGLSLIGAALMKVHQADLQAVAFGLGIVSFTFGFVPMLAEYAKSNWPKK